MSFAAVVAVNTARSNLFKCEALGSFLKSGQVGLSGADVFETEPIFQVEMLGYVVLAISIQTGGFITQRVDCASQMAVNNILGFIDASDV